MERLLRSGQVKSLKLFGHLFSFELLLEEEIISEPGQFAMIKVPGRPLMRPFSIFRVEGEKVSFLIRPIGSGTQLLKELRTGEKIAVILPLGRGYPIPPRREEVWLLAGGVGIASLFPLALKLRQCEFEITLFWGAKTSSWFPLPILSELSNNRIKVRLVTEDGSMGIKGILTEVLPLDKVPPTVYCCGPKGMTEEVLRLIPQSTRLYVSLEERMACGIGACQSCAFPTPQGHKLVCKHGPVFPREELL